MDELSDSKIVDSWGKNSRPWITAVQHKQIESRKLVTDQAIVDTVAECAGSSVLDIGCGEGWLARRLALLGMEVTGVDVVTELIAEARKSSEGKFEVLAYEDISSNTITETFDVVVCNFSLLGKESVEHLFDVVPALLNENGHFIIQTVHPLLCCGEQDYVDGWREGSWLGFSEEFSDPPPWYFRTTESWLTLLREKGFELLQLKEPVASNTSKAASMILVGRVVN